jgi:hypothetical protein
MRYVLSTGLAILVISGSSVALSADKARATKHMTAAQVSSCVQQATSTRAGNITKLEVKVDDNRTICEVHLEDAKGKNFEAHVDVAANKVLRVKD